MNKKFFPEPVEALLFALLVIAGTFILTLSIHPILSNIIEDNVELDTYLTIIFSYLEILLLIVPFIYCYKKKFAVKEIFRLNSVSIPIIFFSSIIGISLFILTDEIERFIKIAVPPSQAFQEMFKPLQLNTPAEWFFLIIGSAGFSAIGEEGLFRGFLQSSLEKKGDPSRAVILTSIAWALIYLNPYLAIPVFILGVFMGYVAWKTKSLLPSIAIHSTFALLSAAMISETFSTNLEWYTLGDHVSPFMILMALGGLYLAIKNIEAS